ncbi:sterol desaturase family protein [Pseudomarimonas salicorniae]|uniref:Sterol desaturase family protein n=1 Tax=Pseudomarimonas salicorniae TaxID=2933270 RepID=A0ABT0GF65_9GAMM|nr:sterol desaturase family protein [Lysobacter sp. CAU 1642]
MIEHAAIQRYREHYRATEIPHGYRPLGHLLFTFGGGLLAFATCLWLVDGLRPVELLAVPAAFLYANFAEYVGHRWPMHRPFRGLGLIYKRHAGQHHRFFTDQAMPFDGLRDLRAVLFPPSLVLFFFGGFGIPAWWALDYFFGSNVAWLFIATAIAYYLNYEFLHTAYHLPAAHSIARIPLVRRLKWLHQTHHDPRQMAHANFNISYPLGDWLCGTLRRRPLAGAEQRPATQATGEKASR